MAQNSKYTIEIEAKGFDKLLAQFEYLKKTAENINKNFVSGFSNIEKSFSGLKKASDNTRSSLGRIALEGEKIGKNIRAGANEASNSIKRMNSLLSVDIFIRLADVATRAFSSIARSILEVQEKWTELQAITDNNTFQGMLKTVKNIPAELANWKEATSILYEVQSAGIQAKETQEELIKTTLKLSKISATAPQDTIKLMTTLTNVYNLNAIGVKRYSDKLFQLVKDAKVTLPELASNLGKVATQSKLMGLSFDETLSAIGAFKNAGLSTEEAMTRLNAVLRFFARNGGAEAIKTAGGFANAIKNVVDNIDPSKDKMKALFDVIKETEGVQGFAILSDNIKNLREETERLQNSVGTVSDAWNKVRGNLDIQVKAMKNAFNNLLASFGVAIAPIINPIIKGVTKLLETISKLPNSIKILITSIGGIAVAIPILIQIKGILSSIGLTLKAISFSNPFAWIGLAISGIITLLASSEEFRNAIINGFNAIYNTITNIIINNKSAFENLFNSIINLASAFWNIIKNVGNAFMQAFGQIGATVLNAFGANINTSQNNFNLFIQVVIAGLQNLTAFINNVIVPAINLIGITFNIVNETLIKPAIQVFTEILKFILNPIQSLKQGFSDLFYWINLGFSSAKNYIINFGTNLLNLLNPINVVKQAVSGLISLLRTAVGLGNQAGIKGSRYSGGSIASGGLYLVHSGEKVIPPIQGSFYSGGTVESTGAMFLPSGATVLNRQAVMFGNDGSNVVINVNNPQVDSLERLKQLEKALKNNFVSRNATYIGG